MAQSKETLEEYYREPDPWGFITNPDDKKRKQAILKALGTNKYERALDVGAGEGWITKDLPAKEIHAIELSDKAAERLPKNVKRIHEPHGFYDLIVATGVLYEQYDYQQLLSWIKQYAKGTVLVAGIKDWLIDTSKLGKLTSTEVLNYRDFQQEIRIYKV